MDAVLLEDDIAGVAPVHAVIEYLERDHDLHEVAEAHHWEQNAKWRCY